jgi:hypothetical protein
VYFQEEEQSQNRNGDGAERMFNRFEGQMMAFNENLTKGFDIMHNQMRNLIGAVKDKMVPGPNVTTPEFSSSIVYALYKF